MRSKGEPKPNVSNVNIVVCECRMCMHLCVRVHVYVCVHVRVCTQRFNYLLRQELLVELARCSQCLLGSTAL